MPGLLGIVSAEPKARVEPRFRAVLQRMRGAARTHRETFVSPDGRWALGRVHLGRLQPAPQLGSSARVRVLFHGDLHNRAQLRATLEHDRVDVAPGDAALVSALYERHGHDAWPRLRGAFCAVVLDEDNARVVLVSDEIGSYPVYWFTDDEGLAFASELHALLAAHPAPMLDLDTVATMASVGFPFGEGTLAAGVRLMAPASAVTWDWRTGQATTSRYTDLGARFRQDSLPRPEYERLLVERFSEAMDHAVDGGDGFGLSLSGGLDTRVLLAALDRRHIPLATFTIGGKGCADEAIAKTLSRMVASDHRFIELGNQYLGDLVPNMQRMVALTDGMYISHGFTEGLALQAFEASSFQVLLRGHVGELAKTSTAWPLHTDARTASMTSRDEFTTYIARRLDGYYHGASLARVFPSQAELFGAGHGARVLTNAIAGADLPTSELCSYLYLHEYTRRVTIPSLEIFRDVVEVRMPLADPVFLDAVTQGRREWREQTEIHRLLIGANGRKFLGVRNTNTGARAGAGPAEEWVFDKINSVLRRLNVPGYRHYHAFFDGWMRQAFLDSVERVLLAPEALDRRDVSADGMRALVADAKQGSHEHDHVLQVLASVELWQRDSLPIEEPV